MMHPSRPALATLVALALGLGLAGCLRAPEVAGAHGVTPGQNYPVLTSTSAMLARVDAANATPSPIAASPSGRIAALQARARLLRRPVLEDETRARMQGALN